MDKLTPEQIKAIKDKAAIKSKAVDNGKIIKK
jgi:hypothetical protein